MQIQKLPRPTRFMFWCTSPFFILTLVLFPVLVNPGGMTGWLTLGAFEALLIFTLFGMYDAHRFNWCWRIVGGIVGVGYFLYFISTVVSGEWFDDRSGSFVSAFKALIGLIIIGYPSFMYATFGRFTGLAESVEQVCEDNPEGVEDVKGDSTGP